MYIDYRGIWYIYIGHFVETRRRRAYRPAGTMVGAENCPVFHVGTYIYIYIQKE